jgi:RNA polymerase sigma-70 factor (ECF subfamily)
MPATDRIEPAVAAAQAGDELAFSDLVERYRPELQVHCYRLLGSREDSEDLTQETFLRAWRKRRGFKGTSTFRAWLYRIATNACLDVLARRPHREFASDELLKAVRSSDAEPDEAIVSLEAIELATQRLSPKQGAALILRDVFGWSAKDSAAHLDTTVASVNSALQRARSTVRGDYDSLR